MTSWQPATLPGLEHEDVPKHEMPVHVAAEVFAPSGLHRGRVENAVGRHGIRLQQVLGLFPECLFLKSLLV